MVSKFFFFLATDGFWFNSQHPKKHWYLKFHAKKKFKNFWKSGGGMAFGFTYVIKRFLVQKFARFLKIFFEKLGNFAIFNKKIIKFPHSKECKFNPGPRTGIGIRDQPLPGFGIPNPGIPNFPKKPGSGSRKSRKSRSGSRSGLYCFRICKGANW